EVERDTVYVNQQITWTLGFYTDGRIELLRTPEFSPPSAEGFWVEDLPPQKNYYQQIAGRRYLVNELKRGLFAATPGEFKIGVARVDLVINDVGRRSSSDVFGDLFNRRLNSFGFGKPVTLRTEEIDVTVLPLPSRGRPNGFSGLVGRGLTLSARTDKNVTQVGEPVNLTIEIRGEGNFKTMSAPKLVEPAGFKMYESGSTSDLFKKDYVVAGRKKYEYVLVPKLEGNKTIPPVEMAYFDPVAKAYQSIRSQPIHLEIMPGTEDEGRRVIFAGSGEDIEVLSQDINYIHPVPAMVRAAGTGGFPSKVVVTLHALPLLALFASIAIERRRKRLRENASYARASRAAREAEKKFNMARRVHKRGNISDVYPLVSDGIRGYFADKMNVPAPGITLADLERFFVAKGIGDDTSDTAKSVLKICDGARYAPGATGDGEAGNARHVIERASELIKELEKRYLS
ncbi:MAG: protein BatD, partial [Candidatus Latescibacterota bacterium]